MQLSVVEAVAPVSKSLLQNYKIVQTGTFCLKPVLYNDLSVTKRLRHTFWQKT
jgi:hypothetical protein